MLKTKIQMNSFLSASPFGNGGSWPTKLSWDDFPTFKKLGLAIHDHLIPHHRNNYHPHLLSHRMIALVSILAVAIKIAGVSLVAFSPAATTLASEISHQSIVQLTNQARTQNSLGELKVSGLLNKAAQNKANDMLARQYFSHNTPDGATPWSFIKAVGYSYTTAGENLAIDFVEAESVQTAWMNSPGHRANILNGNFTEIGIGIARGIYDNHNTIIVVQMFGNPVAQQVEVSEQPTSVAQPAANVPAAQPQIVNNPVTELPTQQPQAETPSANDLATQHEGALANAASGIDVLETKTSLQGKDMYLEILTTPNVVKALVFYGDKSIILNPLSETLWQGKIPMANIGGYDNVLVQVQDLAGNMHQEPIAEFSNSLEAGFAAGEVEGESVTVFGKEINPNVWEEKVFLIILAVLIAGLIIAIGIKRHIQHIGLVANTSFAAMLIAMLMLV